MGTLVELWDTVRLHLSAPALSTFAASPIASTPTLAATGTTLASFTAVSSSEPSDRSVQHEVLIRLHLRSQH